MRYQLTLTVALTALFTHPCWADQREDAVQLFDKLKRDPVASQYTGELADIESTLVTADMHQQLNDKAGATRYYQQAISKSELLQKKADLDLPKPTTASDEAPSDSALPQPASLNNPQTGEPPVAPTTDPKQAKEATTEAEKIDNSPKLQPISSSRLVGTIGEYTVRKGDTLRMIAARLGVSRNSLAEMNKIRLQDVIHPGQTLRYNNQRIIPHNSLQNGILINIPDRMLYLYQKGNLTYSTAVALGVPVKNKQFNWQTPTGRFKITNKAKNPTWTVPPSIQEEMRLQGKEVLTVVEPGPENPLGRYAIRTSIPGILIHGTTQPWSIYTYSSHGCIRVFPQQMEELFKLVRTNLSGEIIYKPVKLAVTENNRILLEVNGDIYNRTNGILAETKSIIRKQNLDHLVNWEKVLQAVNSKSGVAEDVTLDLPAKPAVAAEPAVTETIQLHSSSSPS